MIKKFKEYINESNITKEELEDQFLRLREVFNCYVILNLSNEDSILIIIPSDQKNNKSMREEMRCSIERLRSIYHNKKVVINKYSLGGGRTYGVLNKYGVSINQFGLSHIMDYPLYNYNGIKVDAWPIRIITPYVEFIDVYLNLVEVCEIIIE